MQQTTQIKLHLGCGTRHIPHYTNVDADPQCNPDVLDDICTLGSFKNNSADVIYCSHVLEHFPRKDVPTILKRWYEVLKPGGVLRIAVPDMEMVFRHYIYHQNFRMLNAFLYGSQENEYQFHKSGWDFVTLSADLASAGFTNIQRYDWRNLEHYYIDDHSQGYLPHMQKETGVLMSLNVEAYK